MNAYRAFIVITFLFFFGGTLGWLLELLYRRFLSPANPSRKWLNPGFLTGPCLPLYGFGVVVLYILSMFEAYFVKVDSGGIVHYAVMFFVMALAMTAIEYIAGIIFIKGMNIKLWDYSNEWGNIKGIICPRFTLIWGVLSLLYYFFVFPPLDRLVVWFTEHPWFSFIVGIFLGVFAIDFAFSVHLGAKLRKAARDIDRRATFNMQNFQRFLSEKKLSKFFTPNDDRFLLTARLEQLEEFIRRSPDKVNGNPSAKKA